MSAPSRLVWFKGAPRPADQCQIHVLSPTSQFGLNVFEGIRCYWSVERQQLYVFRLDDHLRRLRQSCRLIGITCPYTAEQLRQHLFDTIRANGYREDIAVRLTLFVDGEGGWASCDPVEMFIAPIPKARTDLGNLRGQSACISTWERISDRCLPPRIKAGANYINGRYAHIEAKRNGYDLPILLNADGRVAEGAGSCLCMVRDGAVCTPPSTASVLESITRASLEDIAAVAGISFRERDIDRTELMIADELFLCGSAVELTPLTSIDRLQIADGQPGPITRRLLTAYLDAASGRTSTRMGWLTEVY